MNNLSDLRDLIRVKFPTITIHRFPGYVLQTSHGDFDLGPKGFARDSVYYETEKAMVKDLERLSKLPATKADPAPGVTAEKPTRTRSARPSAPPPAPIADELMESVTQMDEIVRGKRQPSREFQVTTKKTVKKPVAVKKVDPKSTAPKKKAPAKKKAATKKAPPPPKGPPTRLVHPVRGELKPKPVKKVKKK